MLFRSATPEYETAHNWPVADGRWFTAQEVRSSAKVVLLGNTVAEQLFEGGDPIGQTVRIKTVPFLVIGVLAAKGESLSGQDQDDVMLMPVTTAETVFGEACASAVVMFAVLVLFLQLQLLDPWQW